MTLAAVPPALPLLHIQRGPRTLCRLPTHRLILLRWNDVADTPRARVCPACLLVYEQDASDAQHRKRAAQQARRPSASTLP